MKKIIVAFFFLVIALIIIFFLTRLGRKEPELERVKINGKEYSFLLFKYDPPYSHTKLLASREEADCSTPEGTSLAQASAVGRDRDWYLSLFDEGARAALLKRDQKTGGKILEEYSKRKPLPDPQKTGNYSKFLYKVELEYKGKKYAIIHYKALFEGIEEDYPSFKTFVKQRNVWLETDDLKEHPVEMLIGLKSYDEIKEILKEGSWSVE